MIQYTFYSTEPQQDISAYANYLVKHTYFRYNISKNKKDGKTVLVANAEENGKIILIEIKPKVDGYVITYKLSKGVIITVL